MSAFDLLEKVFGWLLPPASREHVLGDLRETCPSPARYFATAVSVLAPVIVSRIRRTTDGQVFLLEIVSIYISFAGAALLFGAQTFLHEHSGFARLAIPTVVTASALLLCNAYADPEKQRPLMNPVLQGVGCVSVAFLGQALTFDKYPGSAIPFGIMLWGSCVSVVLVSTLRMLFPPMLSRDVRSALRNEGSRPGRADINLRVPLQRWHWRISYVRPVKAKVAVLFGLWLMATAFLFSREQTGLLPAPQLVVLTIVCLALIVQMLHKRE